jgi:hypothetical protein
VNIKEGDPNERPMTTGLHIVRDTFCVKCDAHVGWKYVSAPLLPTLPYPNERHALHNFCQAPALSETAMTDEMHWQDRAYENSQKYKEGKFILEREMIKTVE